MKFVHTLPSKPLHYELVMLFHVTFGYRFLLVDKKQNLGDILPGLYFGVWGSTSSIGPSVDMKMQRHIHLKSAARSMPRGHNHNDLLATTTAWPTNRSHGWSQNNWQSVAIRPPLSESFVFDPEVLTIARISNIQLCRPIALTLESKYASDMNAFLVPPWSMYIQLDFLSPLTQIIMHCRVKFVKCFRYGSHTRLDM